MTRRQRHATIRLAVALLLFSANVAVRPQPTGAGAADEGIPSELPVGAIVAFMPRVGADYRDLAGLRRWLDARGWAICDGGNGTPDLRNRMLLGTTEIVTSGQRLGSREHDHRIRGETGTPVRRNRNTPTGRQQLLQIPDDQHRHQLDLTSARAEHLPPSLRVMFIMKVR